MKLPISIIILAFNEERYIKDCLESVCSWADEVFVVDSGSTDKTIEVARNYTDKIYFHPFENYAKQRNWAQTSLPIKNEWVFHLDQDEKVSPELSSELKKIFSSDLIVDGFLIPRRTVFMGKWIRWGGHYPAYQLRIYKKAKGICKERLYDTHFAVDGTLSKVKGDIINVINSDLKLWKTRHRKWACMEARDILFGEKQEINMKFTGNPIEKRTWFKHKIYYKMPLFIRPFIYFFNRFLIRLGFLDGRQGLIFHFWQGFWYRFLVDLELYKLSKQKI